MLDVRRLLVSAFAVAAIAFAQGCSPSPTADAGRPAECEAIVERCHDLDPGSGPIHECHEFAEDRANNAAACMARQSQCFSVCVATDGGTDAPTGG